MSSTNLTMSESAIQARVREKLNVENVRLWTEPFYDVVSKQVVADEVLALASRYATELKLREAETVECLYALQRNALERLAERDLFKSTGLSTVRIRFSGFSTESTKSGNIQRIQVNLSTMTGKGLRERVAEIISMDEHRLKLICLGRVIKDPEVLEVQNVKNGSQIMVLCVAGSTDQAALSRDEDQFRQLEETRGAADYLAGKTNTDQYSLHVADQHGKPLDLPAAEKKALAVALALHEKGRASMKIGEFSRAIVFLLESDTAYNQCQASILEMVDNYGLVNLDIAWCYLMLQSISELPAVESRLGKCERALHRSYGENMERVVALKGSSSGLEAALFVRLHLLQGITSYHLGHIEKAKFFIRKVEQEIEGLRISDEQLADMINIGYSADEARMALRATYGNMDAAVNYILQKREEQEALRKQEKEDRRRRRLQKRLGMTENGEPINVSLFQNMKEMGYHPVLAMAALKRCNNDISSAVQLVTDNLFVSAVISDMEGDSTLSTSSIPATNVSGSNETSQPTQLPPVSRSLAMLLDDSAELEEDTSEDANPTETERSQKAYENLSKDIASESEYIDLALSSETEYLHQYKSLLQL